MASDFPFIYSARIGLTTKLSVQYKYMPQAEIDPPAQIKVCYQTTALPLKPPRLDVYKNYFYTSLFSNCIQNAYVGIRISPNLS